MYLVISESMLNYIPGSYLHDKNITNYNFYDSTSSPPPNFDFLGGK